MTSGTIFTLGLVLALVAPARAQQAQPPPCDGFAGNWLFTAMAPDQSGGEEDSWNVVEQNGTQAETVYLYGSRTFDVFLFKGQVTGRTWAGQWTTPIKYKTANDVYLWGRFELELTVEPDGKAARAKGWLQALGPHPHPASWDAWWFSKSELKGTKRCG